jgi:hypothetical protein
MHRSKEEFEKKLKEFFDRHDPAKKEVAHLIAAKFHHNQDEIFEHLSEVYHKKEHIDDTNKSFASGPLSNFNGGG